MTWIDTFVQSGIFPMNFIVLTIPEAEQPFLPNKALWHSDTTKTFRADELNDFKRAIEKHFTWSC